MGILDVVGKLFGKRTPTESERERDIETSVELPVTPRTPPEPRFTSAELPAFPPRPSQPQRPQRAYQARDEHLDSIDCPSDEGLIRDLDPMDADVRRIDPLRARRAEGEGAPSSRESLEPLNRNPLYLYDHPDDLGASPPQTERALPLQPPDTRVPQSLQGFLDEQEARSERHQKRRARGPSPEPAAPRPERTLFRLTSPDSPPPRPSSHPMERVGGGVYVPSLREVSMRMYGWIQQNAPLDTAETEGVWFDYLTLCPDDLNAKESYGWYLLDFKGTEAAVQYFLTQTNTEYSDIFMYHLAQLSFQIADYEAAYSYIENLYRDRGDDVKVLSLKYRIEMKSNRREEAQRTYAQLERYAPPELVMEVLNGR